MGNETAANDLNQLTFNATTNPQGDKWGKNAEFTTVAYYTFALEALFSKNTDKGKELCDLFQIEDGGVIKFNYGH